MATPHPKASFVLCIEARDCGGLVRGKVYRAIPDESAAAEAYVRIVDESRESCGRPTACDGDPMPRSS